MSSRMDRYNDEATKTQFSRAEKNKDLYENIGKNTRYTNFTDVTNATTINLNEEANIQTRQGYHKLKNYQDIAPIPKSKKELNEISILYQDHENKVYDVNRILEQAHKNRISHSDEEEKRKLSDSSYNILTNLTKEQLEQYRKERTKKVVKPDEEELKELINTITSKTLAGEIDKATSLDLLSDLMATSVVDTVEPISEENASVETEEDKLSLSKEVLDKEQLDKIKEVKEKEDEKFAEKLTSADSDFYTKSMDLSDKDFETSLDFEEAKMPGSLKFIIVIVILIAIAAAAYFIWKKFL